MTPYKHQLEVAEKGYDILKKFGLVYLAMEERTGKSLSSILIAEKSKAKNILILTKKAALEGWQQTLKSFNPSKSYTITTFQSAHKLSDLKYDLVIVDEAHSSGMSTYPKPSQTYKIVKVLTFDKPGIFLSATPFAESFSQLYHQLNLTKYSPFTEFRNFYRWFEKYGVPKEIWRGGRRMVEYKNTKNVWPAVKQLFIKMTRAEIGFDHEPEDVLHYLELKDSTKNLYNKLLKESCLDTYIADSPIKLRSGLYQIEGGTLKGGFELGNTEKIAYIKQNFRKDVAIMANFVAEQELLKQHFPNVYSSTAHAEGVDLSHIEELVVYSMNFSTSQFIQRRARQANKQRSTPIKVHFLLVKGAVSEQVYQAVAEKKQNFTNNCFSKKAL